MEKQEKNSFKKDYLPQRLFVPILVVSLIFGALAGGVAGLITGSIYSGSLEQWLKNPLGVNSQNTNQNNTEGQLQIISSEEEAVVQAVNKVAPAVVSIIVTKELQQFYNYSGPGFPFDDFFNDNFPFDNFFFSPPEQDQSQPPATEKQRVGGGTGFIVSTDGLILTNKHVVSDADAEYSVVLNNGQSYEAKVVARDPFNDLALIKIEAKDLPTVELGDSDQVKIGQTVVAIGFSLGEYSNSVTKGVISGKGRDIVASGGGQSERLEDVFQTDAAINPGNSGGPLINLQGQVIAINSAINLEGQLIGFAIPINVAKSVVENVKVHGRIIRAYLGVRYMIINKQIKEKNNLSVDYGALIVRGSSEEELAVLPGSPANKAGLMENDIILEVDGVKINQDNILTKEIAKHQPGDTITLKIIHQGEEKNISATLEEYKE
ncbi:trypsin-like peptidase domain-containing protein [Patescibacteria group bacterium]|nr:trypsin-like peptidase domain-containing protein [Patescibacteria group bacterium]